MELPRALLPWSAALELFPRELATALGPLIQRLDLVIGPLQTSARQGAGDPDGFNGIARRGSYERLLISEWLLAEEFPEEFARRAAMGEHGFLELARRQPAGARTSVALFDAGPDQLGAPRLAHIAALIVLARRAEAAGVGFQWGVLQQPAGTLHTSLTTSTILSLLHARTLREATDADVADWREHVGSQPGADDLWIVGRERLSTLPAVGGASLLQIADPYLPDANTLHATVTDRGRTKPTVTLELPPQPLCVRLLRDPFAVRRAEPRRFSGRDAPITRLAFAPGGRKLMARSGTDHVMIYPIPNSPHEAPGKPKAYHTQPPRPILAAGRVGKSLALVTTTETPNLLRIEYVGRKSGRFQPIEFRVPDGLTVTPPTAASALGACCLLQCPPDEPDRPCWLILVENRLLRLPEYAHTTPGTPVYATVETEYVVAATLGSTGYALIGKESAASPLWAHILLNPHFKGGKRINWEFDDVLAAHCGYHGSDTEPIEGLFAVEQDAGQWTIMMQRNDLWPANILLHTSPEDEVVGVVAWGDEQAIKSPPIDLEPRLIILKPDRRSITAMGREWVRSVPPASSPIVHFATNPYGPDVAYLTEQGELVVYSLRQRATLCTYQTRAES